MIKLSEERDPMDEILNGYVDFRADYTYPDSIDIAPGKELANLLAEQLPAHGIAVENVEDLDIAYYVKCRSGELILELMVVADADEFDGGFRWCILPTLVKRSDRKLEGAEPEYRKIVFAIDDIIKGCDRIHDVRWFPQFFELDFLKLLPSSPGPVRDPSVDNEVHPLIRLSLCYIYAPHTLVIIGLFVSFVLIGMTGSKILLGIATCMFLGWLLIVPVIVGWLTRREARRRSLEER